VLLLTGNRRPDVFRSFLETISDPRHPGQFPTSVKRFVIVFEFLPFSPPFPISVVSFFCAPRLRKGPPSPPPLSTFPPVTFLRHPKMRCQSRVLSFPNHRSRPLCVSVLFPFLPESCGRSQTPSHRAVHSLSLPPWPAATAIEGSSSLRVTGSFF